MSQDRIIDNDYFTLKNLQTFRGLEGIIAHCASSSQCPEKNVDLFHEIDFSAR